MDLPGRLFFPVRTGSARSQLCHLYGSAFSCGCSSAAFRWICRKQSDKTILDADASPYYTDDDEYWKLGWYNNPDDHHLFVQNRFNSLNYSLNFGRPGAKVFMAAFTAAIIALVIWIFSAIISLSNTEVIFTINNQTCQFEASGYECTFDPDEILSVELTDSFPVLEIRLDDMTIFANSSDSEITRQWYTELTDYIH